MIIYLFLISDFRTQRIAIWLLCQYFLIGFSLYVGFYTVKWKECHLRRDYRLLIVLPTKRKVIHLAVTFITFLRDYVVISLIIASATAARPSEPSVRFSPAPKMEGGFMDRVGRKDGCLLVWRHSVGSGFKWDTYLMAILYNGLHQELLAASGSCGSACAWWWIEREGNVANLLCLFRFYFLFPPSQFKTYLTLTTSLHLFLTSPLTSCDGSV